MIALKNTYVFAVLGMAGVMLPGCEPPAPTLGQSEPPVVTVSQPLEKDITDFDQYTGRIEAAQTVEVRARVHGELIRVLFKDGDLVKEGQPLFELDPRPYKAELDLAQAKKANAEANLKLADTEYKRTVALRDRNAVSEREQEMWFAKKGIGIAEVSQAEAGIDQCKLNLDFTKINAPITGRISRALVTKGNLVNSGGGDTLLTTIVSVDPMYVYFDVDERSLELYRQRRAKETGTEDASKPPVIPIFLGLIADDGTFPREGVIDFAENRINPATGTIRVRGVFPNKDGRLTPGQFARVRLPIGEKYKGLLVTDQAIGIDQGQKYLLIVNKDNKAEYRPVTPGRLEGDLRIFPPGAGLKAGEWVIVNGVQRVRPGIEVRPEQVPMPTRPAARGKDAEAKKQTEK
jgi:RND family efflux transporter MFP subunit